MNLYIKVENGQPIKNPVFEENLLQVFGAVFENWEPFVRVEKPTLGVYQILESPEPIYQKVNGVWTDVWSLREMTAEEKSAKQQVVKDAFAARDQASNWSAWTFDEDTCKYQPPIPRPTDREVIWSGANNDWVDKPQKPDDGKTYRLDFYTSSWVEITQE
jgi:hypothetical protein